MPKIADNISGLTFNEIKVLHRIGLKGVRGNALFKGVVNP